MWTLFSREELINAIEKCNNSLAPGSDKLSWSYIKRIIKNNKCITKLINIANTYINLEHQPSHFKTSTTVVIYKPNKVAYNSPKSFHSIVLLNTIEKLFEKIIRERLQFLTISNNFIYLCQLGSFKHRSTIDTSVILTHFIQLGQVKNLSTSTLAFDIAQFFLSLNCQLLLLIIDKVELDQKVLVFFKNYLVERKTKYF